MVSAQEWLDINYPPQGTCIRKNENYNFNNLGKEQTQIRELDISNKKLVGTLNLSNFINLEELHCSNNKLSNLVLPSSDKLIELYCDHNLLTNLNLSKYENLETLWCCNNRLTNLNISSLSTDLTCLNIKGNNKLTFYSQSFSHLINLNRLEISDNQKIGNWSDLHKNLAHRKSTINEYEKSIQSDQSKDAQLFFDREFPIYNVCLGELDKKNKGKNRSNIKKMNLSNNYLEGPLTIENFPNMRKYIILRDNKLTNLKFVNCPKIRRIWCENNNISQAPFLLHPSSLIDLNISNNNISGFLNLENKFINLEYLSCYNSKMKKLSLRNCKKLRELICHNNDENFSNKESSLVEIDLTNCSSLEQFNYTDGKLTNLNFNGCSNLTKINCRNNRLTDLNLLFLFSLTSLDISDNNFSRRNLSTFSNLVNLKELKIGNLKKREKEWTHYNSFYGSLNYLENLKELKIIDFSNTEINKVNTSILPRSLKTIGYVKSKRLKFKFFHYRLERYEWKDIDRRFSLRLRREWEKSGFDKRQTRELLKLGFSSVGDDKGCWKRRNFNFNQIKGWMEAGSKPNEYKFINWLNGKKKTYEWALKNKRQFQELRDFFKQQTFCEECYRSIKDDWCQECNSKHFLQNFKDWTSGNSEIDKFIQKSQLEASGNWQVIEWIPYEDLESIEYIAEGGFGKIYKSSWSKGGPIEKWDFENNEWKRITALRDENRGYEEVALKVLENSLEINSEILQEVANHNLFGNYFLSNEDGGDGYHADGNDICVAKCYGISQDPITRDYIIVMEYIDGGNIRENLNKKLNSQIFGWNKYENGRIGLLSSIAEGLNSIHEKGLIHKDFHSGNILCDHLMAGGGHSYWSRCYITDLGLSRPINEIDKNKGKIYGVLPYVAPEILKGQPYTQASDIYSFGMIAYELITTNIPYNDLNHNQSLAQSIINGLRPNLDFIEMPENLRNLVKQCWDANPARRPNASELKEVCVWKCNYDQERDSHDISSLGENYSDKSIQSKWYFHQSHSQAIYTSRLLDFKNLLEPQNNYSQQWQTTTLLELKIHSAEEEIELIKKSLSSKLQKLLDCFIEKNKQLIKNQDDEDIMEIMEELHEKLEAEGISEKDIEKLTYWSERLVELEKKKDQNQIEDIIEVSFK